MIAHIILFSPKPSSTEEQQQELLRLVTEAGSRGLVARVRVGLRVAIGAEYEDKIGRTTYSHAAILEFGDRDDLLRYLADPFHERIGRLFWVVCNEPLIVDLEMSG